MTPNANNSNNVYSDTVTVSGNGTYTTSMGTTPGGYTPTAAGTYQWVAVYSGDAGNSSVTSPFGSEPETATSPGTPTIGTSPSPTVVLQGTSSVTLTDTATLAGGNNPTGSITFILLSPSGTTLDTETVNNVKGDGTYSTPTGYSLPTSAPAGFYQWNATYSGDGNNSGASDTKNPNEQVAVVNPCCNLTGVTFSVYNPSTGVTTKGITDLRGNTDEGDTVTANFTVPTGDLDQLSLVSYNAPESFFNSSTAGYQTVYQSVTQIFGSGAHSLVVTLPSNFYQVDFVCGTVITQLGPDGTSNFYSSQGRLISADNDGTNPAGSGVLSVTGEVYDDQNSNGKLDSGEPGLKNVTVNLSGTDAYGASISMTATTNSSGNYTFSGMPFSNSAGYTITVSVPSGDSAGLATVGKVNSTADGTAATKPESVKSIVLATSSQTSGSGYNFGILTSSCVSGSKYSVVVLDSTTSGALTLSGSASINVPGAIVINSSSSTAISGSGTASLTASIIDVVGGFSKASGETFSPTPATGSSALADPLASLATPSLSGLTNYGSYSKTSGSYTISPGIYNSISISGTASLTMNPGTYIIKGGGFTISGSGNVSGSGVTIYNAGSYCPSSGGNYGNISWSSTGTFSLSAPTSGTYCGILIFQSRDNPQTVSIGVSGKSGSAITGTIYAADAKLVDTGSTPITGSLVVNLLSISNSAVANAVSLNSPTGSVAYTPAQVRAAYGISNLTFDGSGQTIAVVDAYDNPNILESLDTFDAQFGLTANGTTLFNQYGPASSFLTVLGQSGQTSSLPATDPAGAGNANWELETALDVEWIHAIAPGAQIVLVEASSQSLSDLMAGVATAASQPGVSVVTMSWGFPEGQAVFAADEANYDSVFNVPGVTFLASTGDYGTSDPEYPAFSPNVVAVGGTSLILNSDQSYNSETGWGYYADSLGTSIGSGGGLSLYQPEPSYQQGVQSTGSRTTPDVSLIADPATGAWIADTYNLGLDNPFEVAGGTSLSSPAFAGLIALVNEGRVAAGEGVLNSASPTETQQALYSLPQSDYNMIASGSNGYTANTGYNLVTGLGTPVANLMVPDLVAYQGPGTTYSGPTVSPLQDATLSSTWSTGGSITDAFNVFSALTVSSRGFSDAQRPAAGNVSGPASVTPAPSLVNLTPTVAATTTPALTTGSTLVLSIGSFSLQGPAQALGSLSHSTSDAVTALPMGGLL